MSDKTSMCLLNLKLFESGAVIALNQRKTIQPLNKL